MSSIVVDGSSLTVEDVVAVSRDLKSVEVAGSSLRKAVSSREAVEKAVSDGKTVYGITTGFGALSNKRIDVADIRTLQKNIILSHQTAVGPPLKEDVVRASMLIRLNSLAKGHSGVRPELLTMLSELLNREVHPVIPEQGSVGASGDLSQLAHMAAIIVGLGRARYLGEVMEGKSALDEAGLTALELEAKEGLALTNGTSVSASMAVLALWDSERLVKTADITGAMSVEAARGRSDAFKEEIQELRPYRGQGTTAANIRRLTEDSSLIDSEPDTIQDGYSLRCIPQVHGAIREALAFVRRLLEIEINSATDNPLIFPERGAFLSGGNFHGHPIALAMDLLSSSMASLGSICERRVFRLLSEHLSGGLPPFLVERTGLNTGYMMLQYTAASLVSENKILAHSASVDTIPTSADQEDFNSMSMTAATKAARIVRNVEKIVATELLSASQALDLREPESLGRGTSEAKRIIREKVPPLVVDRDLSGELGEAISLVRSGLLLDRLNKLVE